MTNNLKLVLASVLISLMTLIICLFLLESYLILNDKGKPLSDGDYGWSTWNKDMEINDGYIAYKLSSPDLAKMQPHINEVNQFGFRGMPMGNSPMKIVLLGDSQVETSHPINRMPEKYLTKALEKRIEFLPDVVSMGSWGWGTDQQYLALKKYIDRIKPSHVVLWFTSNDFRDNTYPIGNAGRKPTFWLNDQGLQGPNHDFLEKFDSEKFRFTRLFKRRDIFSVNTDQDKGFNKAYVEPNLSIESAKTKCENEVDFDLSKNFYDFDPYDKSLLSVHNVKYANPRPAWLEYQKNLTNQILIEIKKLVESKGSRFFVFFVTTPDDISTAPKGVFCSKQYGFVEYNYDNFTTLINETFDGVESHLVNLQMDDYKDKFDGHLNDKANEFVMKEIANLISIKSLQ